MRLMGVIGGCPAQQQGVGCAGHRPKERGEAKGLVAAGERRGIPY